MKERPILFNTEMVRAILDGRKTQTRRVITNIKPFSPLDEGLGIYIHTNDLLKKFGVPGDQYYVRETWYTEKMFDDLKPSELYSDNIWYVADDPEDVSIHEGCGRTRPSIFLPKWASRIQLELEKVWIERVQGISEEDAIAEGVRKNENGWVCYSDCECHENGYRNRTSATASFMSLWDSINAKRGYGWDLNPFVIARKFKVIKP